MANDSEFVRHEACPNCTSSDAFARYSDGGGHCFSCNHHVNGNTETELQTTTTTKSFRYSGDFTAIRSRNLNEETCKKFNVRVDTIDGNSVIKFPYYDTSGKVVAYKQIDK